MKPVIALLVMMIGASAAQGQMKVSTALTNVESAPQQALASNDADISLSFKKVSELSKAAEREAIATKIPTIVEKMVADQVSGATEVLRGGQALNMTSSVVAGSNAMDQRSVNVQVTYDARPVGGILNIRVELIPTFGGIGSAVRPTVVRQFAQAVDDFDDDFVGKMIVQLTDELASQYAAK